MALDRAGLNGFRIEHAGGVLFRKAPFEIPDATIQQSGSAAIRPRCFARKRFSSV
ncbi:hypothetical protein C7S16_6955 [Burkholderia thailandensis]|uniref:Uncharacterized protein n=1 Tax=Burkholderia thailandensis TaxID=57975 RepID=A0AAW9CNC2_BURTH|nr:hypothetical protein [Burkholderia thailandensis]MDW9252460.1 hypothetical protein [Burkholderia thailandensis]